MKFGSTLGAAAVLVALTNAGCGSRSGLELFSGIPEASGGQASGGAAGSGGTPSTGGIVGTGGQGPLEELAMDCPLDSADPRLAGFYVRDTGRLDVADFAQEPVDFVRWTVHAEDCDAVLPEPTFDVLDLEAPVLALTPGRPGPQRVTLEAGTDSKRGVCDMIVPVEGRGLRIDLCWDTSALVELDLYLHTPLNQNPYFDTEGGPLEPASLADRVTPDTCQPFNCGSSGTLPRPDFGYADSPLEYCALPTGTEFFSLGFCPNPRAGRSRPQSSIPGTSEIVQIDQPNDGDVLRVMVQNRSNEAAIPQVFVYCDGERRAELDLPGSPEIFMTELDPLPGALWRPADILIGSMPDGALACIVVPLQDPDTIGYPYVTTNEVHY